MSDIVFVSGIDTGTGKTVATGMMARFLTERNLRAATVKPVQTGCHGFSEDVELHRKLMGTGPLPEDSRGLTAPQIFAFPGSPHLAAALEGKRVDIEKISSAVTQVSRSYDVTLVEGAGGLAVPLTMDLLTADLVAERKWPVVLVVSGKLGSLNHALLSLEALARREMTLRGIVYDYAPDVDPVIDRDTPETLIGYLGRYGFPRVLVRLGKVDLSRPGAASCDFTPLFPEVLR